jgi:ABC-type dipeptide/oligopeptide/nickel transport system permease subunit
MPTFKENVAFTIGKIREFFTSFSRSKRGLIGTFIVIAFVLVAAFGPMVAPYDSIQPAWPGYYPAQPPAKLAEPLSVPSWYLYLPGGENLVPHYTVVSDHEFANSGSLNQWNIVTSNPEIAPGVSWNPTKGVHQMTIPSPIQPRKNDACVQVSYVAAEGQDRQVNTSVTMNYDFSYPYKTLKNFWFHTSYLIEGNMSTDFTVYLNYSIYRIGAVKQPGYTYSPKLTTEQNGITIYHYPLISKKMTQLAAWDHFWTRSTDTPVIFLNPLWYSKPTVVIFPEAGNYTISITAVFEDKTTKARNISLYLDNIDFLVYGNTHGLLGTDYYDVGRPRDNFTSFLYGARVSLIVGLLSAFISVSIGLTVGLTAGYMGGLVDEGLMRFADLLMTLPSLPLLIVLVQVLNPSIWNIIGVLAFMGWMGFARNVRAMTLSLRERSFVEAAKASGAGKVRVMTKHILPNVFALVYLALAVSVPGAIVAESSLSFLGLFDPMIITWGRMFYEFQSTNVAALRGVQDYWFWFVPPGIGISLLAISFILIGYSLDDILNPRLRMRR